MRFLAGPIAALIFAGACAGDSPPPARAAVAPAVVLAAEPGLLKLAGSGAMIPLARALASAWQKRGEGPRVVVEESLGSAGGVAAAHEGAVDLGMVSRGLHADEEALGLVLVPVATDAVVIAAHPGLPVHELTWAQLTALYCGTTRLFPDGSPAAVLLRDRAESANRVLEVAAPGLAACPAPRSPWRVLYHDAAMLEALASTPNAIGVTSLGLLTAAGSKLEVLSLDGKRAGPAALLDGSWPLTRPLAFVARPDRLPQARAFLDFVASADGAAVIRDSGHGPKAGPP